jgi:hypothetical protein
MRVLRARMFRRSVIFPASTECRRIVNMCASIAGVRILPETRQFGDWRKRPGASVERKFTLRDSRRQSMRAVTGQILTGAVFTKLSPSRRLWSRWCSNR